MAKKIIKNQKENMKIPKLIGYLKTAALSSSQPTNAEGLPAKTMTKSPTYNPHPACWDIIDEYMVTYGVFLLLS